MENLYFNLFVKKNMDNGLLVTNLFLFLYNLKYVSI